MGAERIENIDMDDLQEQHREYAEVIGIKNLILLAKEFGGTQIYIPKVEDLLKNRKYRAISGEFNGSNIKELAVKYEVSESTVYRIVREQILTGHYRNGKQVEGQMDMFECMGFLPAQDRK